MKYLSTKETAARWGVHCSLVRRYCMQERIPKAILKDGFWFIPSDAKRPPRSNGHEEAVDFLPPLARKLIHQKSKKNYHGLYDYTVVNLTYCSCRMASNRLTREQVESIFRKNKVAVSFEPMKVSDVVEVLNHIICADRILERIDEPLSLKFIRSLHQELTFGTVDERKNKVTPGQFRTKSSYRTEAFASPADSINGELRNLIREYEGRVEINLYAILDFHVRFERIFPFDDCNGRIGRLIAFKECLRHGVMPFIIDDKRRGRYLQGIQNWEHNPDVLTHVAREAQNRFESQVETQRLLAHGQNFLPANYKED